MKKLSAGVWLCAALIIAGCSNDASDGATQSDSTINRVDSRRNTTTTEHTLYRDSVDDKFNPPKTGGTPTNPNTNPQ